MNHADYVNVMVLLETDNRWFHYLRISETQGIEMMSKPAHESGGAACPTLLVSHTISSQTRPASGQIGRAHV